MHRGRDQRRTLALGHARQQLAGVQQRLALEGTARRQRPDHPEEQAVDVLVGGGGEDPGVPRQPVAEPGFERPYLVLQVAQRLRHRAAFAGGYTTNVVAVPEAELMGVDFDLTWLATDNITLGAHASYTGTEYTSDAFVIDPNDPMQPESLFDANSNLINIKGNKMLRVPEKKAGAWAMYSWPLADAGRLEFLANFSYIDRVYFSVFEREDQSAPSYQRFDLRATWHSADESWLVAAFANNVFDEIGWRQIEQYGATEGELYRRTGTPTDPQILGLEVRKKFGG